MSDPTRSPAARLRLFYFLYYATVGVTLPYLTLYLQGLGLDGAQIGLVQMLQPLAAAPAGLLWAALADRLRAGSRALVLSTAVVVFAFGLLVFARSLWSVAAVSVLLGLGGAAIVPLVDALSVEWSRTDPTHSYPRTRLFGSLGYVAAAQGVGLWLASRGSRPADVIVPLALVACSSGYALVSLTFPAPPQVSHARLADMLRLARQPRLLLLLAMCAMHWTFCAPYHLFFGPFVREHGLPDSAIGLASALGVAAEVGVLWFSPLLEARFSARALFASSFALTSLRWALLGRADSGVAIVGLQLLHGATFGLFWATAIRALRDEVPSALRTTGQALFGAVVFQVGSAIGNPVSGWLFDRARHAGPLYVTASLLELAPLLLALMLPRASRVDAAATETPAHPAAQ